MGAQPLKKPRKAARGRSLVIPIPQRSSASFITLEDNSTASCSAVELFDLKNRRSRDPLSEAARLSEQLMVQNRSVLALAQMQCTREFNGRDVRMQFRAGNTIGAIPLLSPTTGKPDYGVIIGPRFSWSGIGPMLAQMGWRVAPTPLKLQTFKGSEKSIPRWVLSSMILARIRALLQSLTRRFELITETNNAPRGTVRWTEYAVRSLPSASFLAIPCTYPDLRQERLLLGTIRYCLERIIEELESESEHGAFVHRLIELAQQLLFSVREFPVCVPSAGQMASWLRKPLRTEFYTEGLQAIQWTLERRGLAGSSNLEGIPWVMEMERFFEAWVETVFHSVARTSGATMKTGRLRQTTKPISWDPPFLGSQKSLIPDLWLQWGSTTLIVDAKYKRHFEELQIHNWTVLESEWKEQHRNDLLQVLAYANLAESRTTISCLVYPCSSATWNHLRNAGKLFHKAEITVGSRALHLWMTAAPMMAAVDQIAAPIMNELAPVLRANS